MEDMYKWAELSKQTNHIGYWECHVQVNHRWKIRTNGKYHPYKQTDHKGYNDISKLNIDWRYVQMDNTFHTNKQTDHRGQNDISKYVDEGDRKARRGN